MSPRNPRSKLTQAMMVAMLAAVGTALTPCSAQEHEERRPNRERQEREMQEREHLERERAEAREQMEEREHQERERTEEREHMEEREHQERERAEEREHMEEREDREREHAEEREDEEWGEEELNERDVLKFLEQHGFGAVLMELREVRRHSRDDYEGMLDDIRERIWDYREHRRENPELAERALQADRLEHESGRLAQAIRHTENQEKREHMVRELRGMIEHIFELRLSEGEFEIHQLERELEKIRHMVEQRRRARDRIIEKRLHELVEGEELEWW